MFVDASAVVAIITEEPGHAELLRCLDEAEEPITSGLAVFETVMALARKKGLPIADARAEIEAFIGIVGLRIVPIAEIETTFALAAHARYGKGRHPARLNLGDSFAYACAKVHGVPLLFVGDDFPQTDIEPALA